MALLGLREFEAALKKVAAQADVAGKAAVKEMAAQVEAAAKGNFQGSHAKGDPRVGTSPARPNVVTGTTRRLIRTDPIQRYGIGDYGTTVAPRAKWSRALELGRTPGAAAYPFFEPAVTAVRPRFPSITADQWRRYVGV
jgi:hypothetical protein